MADKLPWIGLREGRLHEKFDETASEYIYGRRADEQKLLFDAHLWIHQAHVLMLAEEKIIPRDQAVSILGVLQELDSKDVEIDPRLGDVYTNTERYLINKIGEVAGAMHTGRSRNDLSATATRMLARRWISMIIDEALKLQETLIRKAELHLDTLMPGYTHLQQAQPITFGHWVMAYCDFLMHDMLRLEDAYKRTNLSALGAVALAGTGHRINRSRTADLLGFEDVLENSLQCVSSRDYLLETIFGLTLMMNTLNRLHEDIFIWTSNEFGFVELHDSLAGTSSIMPQKKNPLLQETAKGRMATQLGRLMAAFTVFKDLPMGHNFDMYEAGLILKDSVRELLESLHMMGIIIETLKVNVERMEESLNESYITATELADVLVRESGVPFRASHQIVGSLVRRAIEEDLSFTQISVDLIDEIANKVIGRKTFLTEQMIREATDPRVNVVRRNSTGGPAPSEVKRMIGERKAWVSETIKRQVDRSKKLADSREVLLKAVNCLLSSRSSK